VGRALKDLRLPSGTLVALVHRDGDIAVPSGSTVLHDGDRITVLGDPDGIRLLADAYRE
jgi:Trk K+ transport system NAD-binding subunit